MRDIPFILLANKEQSKFYNTKTEYMDSLESTPQGRAVSKQLFNDAIKRYVETKDRSAMYDKMSRIEMLRQLRNYHDHHNAIDGAATGIQ